MTLERSTMFWEILIESDISNLEIMVTQSYSLQIRKDN